MDADSNAGRSEVEPIQDRDLFGRVSKKHGSWEHRRGEPRGLALYWTVFLLLAAVASMAPMVMSGQLSGTVYRPAARVMMILVGFGITVLWPVLRFSQPPQPSIPLKDVTRDSIVLLAPACVLLWPQSLLAGWSVKAVLACTLVLVCWGGFSATLLAWWHRFGGDRWIGRFLFTSGLLAFVGGVPLVLLLQGKLELLVVGPDPTPGWMWSPLTALWEILRDRSWSGGPVAVAESHFRVLRAQLLIAFAFAVVSAVFCRGRGDVG